MMGPKQRPPPLPPDAAGGPPRLKTVSPNKLPKEDRERQEAIVRGPPPAPGATSDGRVYLPLPPDMVAR